MKEENEISKQPRIVKSHDIRIDGDYAEWIAELKHRYRSAQVKASVRVNAEKLLFNWELGRDLVQKKAEERWGAGVVEQVSLDLQREFPNAEGFSTRNIWYMKQWYLFYYQEDTKLHQLGAEIENTKLQRPVAELEDEKLYQVGKEILIQPVREIEEEKMHLLGAEFPDVSIQQGYKLMFKGSMLAIRNPKAHAIETIEREDALRKLAFASMLMYKLDTIKSK